MKVSRQALMVERFGRDAVAQVDLGTREHRNRPVDQLAAQSLAIMATALRRAGLMQFDGPTLELLRADLDGNVEAKRVEIRERPPIATLPTYWRTLLPLQTGVSTPRI